MRRASTAVDNRLAEALVGDAAQKQPSTNCGAILMGLEKSAGATTMAEKAHILLVEDDPLVLEVLEAILIDEYQTSTARTVSDALACLNCQHIDLILLDTVLPDGKGESIAIFADNCRIPVISVSGYPDEIGSQRPHLTKPFKSDALLDAVKEALSER